MNPTNETANRPPESSDQPATVERSDLPPTIGEQTVDRINELPSVPGFEIESELGRGAMGVVYRARQTGLNRTVALKVILHSQHSGPKSLVRFLAEAEAVAKLDHPHIVRIHQSGATDSVPYFALEYLDGGTLADLIRDNPLEPKRAAELVERLGEAMAYSHAQGIVHRDLKPANVMMTRDGLPKVGDFGLAKRLDAGAGMTATGQILGTPSYMAPEQARGENERVNPSTDVYALGAILYALLTSRPPFLGPTSHATMKQVVESDPISPREMQAGVPRDLETICLKCLRKDQEDRYASAAALATDLRAFLEERSISARPMGRLEKGAKWVKKNPSWAAMIALLMLTMVSGTVVSLIFAEREKRKATDLSRALDSLKDEQDRTQQALAGTRVLLAEAAFAGPDGAYQSKNQLDEIPEGYRDTWEIGYLRRKYEGGYATLYGHTNSVNSARFSPDGTRLVSASADGTLQLWDAATGRRLLEFQGHTGGVRSAGFSPDGKRLASAAQDGTVRLWDITTGQTLLELRGHKGVVTSISFSPDSTRLASASGDNTIRVWDAVKGRGLLELKGHTSWVTSVCFSPEGARLVSGSDDGTIRLWDAETGRELLVLKGNGDSVIDVSFSPDGSRFASASVGTVLLWEAATGRVLFNLQGHFGVVHAVSFSPDGTRLASASYDRTVRVWDTATGINLLELKGHTNEVFGVSFSPDGKRLVSASADKSVRLWDVATGHGLLEMRGHTDHVYRVSFSPDGKQLASASADKTVRLWDVATGRGLREIRGHNAAVTSVAFSPDGKRLTSGCVDGRVRLWDASTGSLLMELRGHTGAVGSVSFSPDGKQLASASADKTVRLWDALAGLPLIELKGHEHTVYSVTFSPDGTHLATASEDRSVRLWDVATGLPLLKMSGHKDMILSVSFSPDGTRLASASVDNTVRLWDATTGEALLQLKGHTRMVFCVTFSSDGKRIASASRDNSIRIWDAATGRGLLELRGHRGTVTTVSFSPNGLQLASGADDNTIRLWDAAIVREIAVEKAWPEWAKLQGGKGAISPDGKYVWLDQPDGRILRIPLAVSPREIQFRRAKCLPDPSWHREQIEESSKAKNPFAVNIQKYLLHKATAEEHLDRYRFDQCFYWSVAAQILKPKPPVIDWPESLPPPTDVRLQAFLRDGAKTKDNPERLEYAQLAYDNQKFGLAARLWSEAMVIDPKILEDRQKQHRYNAACATALASDGKGRDEPPLDAAAKEKLRSQALEWLKSELTVWNKLLDSDPQSTATIVRTMRHWQKDSDLSSIRDPESLAKLSAEEQKAFSQLWAEVVDLLKRAEAKAAKK